MAVCVTVTVAPGSTAPLESVTRPDRSAVDCCAMALPAVNSIVNATAAESEAAGAYPSWETVGGLYGLEGRRAEVRRVRARASRGCA